MCSNWKNDILLAGQNNFAELRKRFGFAKGAEPQPRFQMKDQDQCASYFLSHSTTTNIYVITTLRLPFYHVEPRTLDIYDPSHGGRNKKKQNRRPLSLRPRRNSIDGCA